MRRGRDRARASRSTVVARPGFRSALRWARAAFVLPAGLVAGAVLVSIVSCAADRDPPPRDPLGSRVETHVRALASNAYGGRAPGTPGGEAAATYIERVLAKAGVQPGGTDGFRQAVPLVGLRTLPRTRLAWSGARDGPATNPLEIEPELFIGGWNRAEEEARVEGGLVFVGYGLQAAELRRDDLADADLRGKWAVALAGAPADVAGSLPHAAGQPVAKLYAAAGRGAIGLLILSDLPGWPEPYDLGRTERILAGWGGGERGQPIPWVAVRGALVDSLSAGGNLWQEPLSTDFKARRLPGTLRLDLSQEVRRFESPNLVARVPGREPSLVGYHVCLSAHYDGLGRTEERVYPGVIDNAVAVAELLEVARLAGEQGASRRSLLFFFPTGEESGLLGSRYFVEHPTVPRDLIVGCLNKDGAPEAWGRSNDVIAIAAEASPAFAAALRSAVEELGLTWSPNPFPSEGFFFRSDHYSFLVGGVPAVLLFLGLGFEGRPPTWGIEQAMLYLKDHYHYSTDDLRRVLTWDGTAQYARLWLALARRLADGDDLAREIDLTAGEPAAPRSGPGD